jgi:DNA replication protein DnaC
MNTIPLPTTHQRLVGLGAPARIVSSILEGNGLTPAQVGASSMIAPALRRGQIVILHGPYGVGKSTLGVWFMRRCITIAKPRSCRMRAAAGLMAEQKDWFNSYSTGNPSPIERARSVYFLVLDEIAVEGTDYDKAQLAEIIKHRYNNQLPTLIITNVAPEYHHKALTGAVMDRVKDGAVVALGGESMRGTASV